MPLCYWLLDINLGLLTNRAHGYTHFTGFEMWDAFLLALSLWWILEYACYIHDDGMFAICVYNKAYVCKVKIHIYIVNCFEQNENEMCIQGCILAFMLVRDVKTFVLQL